MVAGRLKVQDIIMGKGLQIALVALLYIVCAVGGYFLHDVVMVSSESDDVPVVVEDVAAEVEVPVVDAVPVIGDISAPKRGASGKYSFSVVATVPTEDRLLYVLYSDQECQKEVAQSLDGIFDGLPAVASAKYYVRVQNLATDDLSEVVKVSGFVPVTMYEKITKEEIEKVCNSGDYTATTKLNTRIANGCQIVAQGMNSDERGVSTVADVCNKVMMGTWKSVTVAAPIEYDSQNRMKKLVLRVNY